MGDKMKENEKKFWEKIKEKCGGRESTIKQLEESLEFVEKKSSVEERAQITRTIQLYLSRLTENDMYALPRVIKDWYSTRNAFPADVIDDVLWLATRKTVQIHDSLASIHYPTLYHYNYVVCEQGIDSDAAPFARYRETIKLERELERRGLSID